MRTKGERPISVGEIFGRGGKYLGAGWVERVSCVCFEWCEGFVENLPAVFSNVVNKSSGIVIFVVVALTGT